MKKLILTDPQTQETQYINAGLLRKHQGWQEAETDERGGVAQSLFGDFVGKSGQDRMDMMSKLRTESLNNAAALGYRGGP